MTKKDLEFLAKLLDRVRDPDGHVAKARAIVARDLAQYEARQGQLRESYEYDRLSPW